MPDASYEKFVKAECASVTPARLDRDHAPYARMRS
jgi:hypothetical protein